MSDIITSENLDRVIKENRIISQAIENCCNIIHIYHNPLKISSPAKLGFRILEKHNLILFPRDNVYWSGAIYFRDGKKIPVINTAIPRVNQYFAAWHEVYHILFDEVSFDHPIDNENYIEERKAEYFAAKMLIGDVNSYYNSLDDDNFEDKIFRCMAMFQSPYKAILIALYEEAVNNNNEPLKTAIKQNFDNTFVNISERFDMLGLDNTLVLPSNIINADIIFSEIKKRIAEDPEATYHSDNLNYLESTIKELREINKGSK